jgi:hypothetical protein
VPAADTGSSACLPSLGTADATFVWMMYAVDRSSSLARINGLAVVWRCSRLRPNQSMAEQREPKLVNEVEVYAKALQSQPELGANRIVLNATKQAPAPPATNMSGRELPTTHQTPKEAWK